MKKISSLLAIVAVLIGLSCQRTTDLNPTESPETESSQNSTIQLIDGCLRFESKSHLYSTLNMLAEQQSKLDEFEKQFSGFRSVRTAFKALNDVDNEVIATKGITSVYKGYVAIDGEGDDREITRTISDPLLATVVNKNGWVYVGKDAYQFGRNDFRVVINYTAERLARISADGFTAPGVQVGKVVRGWPSTAGARPAAEDHCLQEYFVGSNKRRMAGVIGFENYSTPGGTFYINVYSVAKHQKRSFGTIWSTSDTQTIGTSGSISVRDYSGNVVTQTFNELRGNTGWAEVGFSSQQGPSLPSGTTWNPVYSNIVNNAVANCNDGVTRNCTVTKY